MIEQPIAPVNVCALRFAGKITGKDVQAYREILHAKLKSQDRLGIYLDFTELSDMNADTLAQGAEADLEFLGQLDRFTRCAFVSDKDWPRAIVHFLKPWLPSFEMRVFGSQQAEQAMAWAGEVPKAQEPLKPPKPAIHFMPTSKDTVFAFEVNGQISAAEMPAVIKEFENYLDRHDKVRLFNRMTGFSGFDPAILLQSGLVPMKLAALQKVERYAIVGAPSWMRRIIEALEPMFVDMSIRGFSADQEAQAWLWLDAELRT